MRERQSRSTLAIVSIVNSVTTLTKSRQRSAEILIILIGLIGSIWPNFATANPLSEAKQRIALRIAHQQPWPEPHITRATNVPMYPSHALSQQTISVEPYVRKHPGRDQQARVYQFNYHTASARMLVISLTQESVVRESPIHSVHLPLNEEESAAALTTLAKNTEAMDLLRNDQIRRDQKPFTDLNELSVKSSIYSPIDVTHPCATQRCALLSLFDQGNTVFAMEPIINLQMGTLGWLNR